MFGTGVWGPYSFAPATVLAHAHTHHITARTHAHTHTLLTIERIEAWERMECMHLMSLINTFVTFFLVW